MKHDSSLPLEYSTEQNRRNIFGFWVFLGAEIMLFATLFTSYFVYENRIGNGPAGAEIFEITPVLLETFLLLTSSFTIGLAINAMRLERIKAMLLFLGITLLLGTGFLGIEIYEFMHYYHVGATLQTSGFTATLLTTLGTHGAHVILGLFWGLFILIQVKNRGLTPKQRINHLFSRYIGISLMLSGFLFSASFT